MPFPHTSHFFNGNILGLRQEEIYKESHEQHEKYKEDEQAKIEGLRANYMAFYNWFLNPCRIGISFLKTK